MKVKLYSDLNPEKIPGFKKFRTSIEEGHFKQADVHKIGDNLYRARLNRSDRLLLSFYSHAEQAYCLVLEYLPRHSYEKSRFLNRGVQLDEDKIVSVDSPAAAAPEPLRYINPASERFFILDKVLSFDDTQQAVYECPAPLVIIGSAGSGKTALLLEKMKHTVGDVLYISLSSFLVQNARNLYYANGYRNDDQSIDFLSYREFLESIRVPAGKEITLQAFEGWFARHRSHSQLKDPHKLFEEFRGVLTGPNTQSAWLSREDYLALGVRQSIFVGEEREQVYTLFERYLQYLREASLFDSNILSHYYLEHVTQRTDFVLIDEVQDITNIQLYLILKTLRTAGEFLLCGDANQIVHPNFFSWSNIKTLFFTDRALTGQGEMMRILHSNYRNAALITDVANRILKLKHARFGSVDKESNYLVNSVSDQQGRLQLLTDSDRVKRDLDSKTARSTQFAVLVMHADHKAKARQWFNTPLVFSIQEAKGLEYSNIILFNFVGSEATVFREIARDVDPAALEAETLNFGRAKDKRDKSLEVYKFFINALYVAVTRAVSNLYLVESDHRHPMIELLQLARFSGDFELDKADSSLEEWQREAHKLAQQGKQAQAEAINARILKIQPVPWPVIDREAFTALQGEALAQNNKKKRLMAFEYALLYPHWPTLNALANAGFKPARQNREKALKQLYSNHFTLFTFSNPTAALRTIDRYGVDHRTVLNMTPLMVSAKLGNTPLVQALVDRGADTELTGSNGHTALHIALDQALCDRDYARQKLATLYPLLAPSYLAIQVEARLIKLDGNHRGLFLLRAMFALFYRQFGSLLSHGEGFSAKQLAEHFEPLPDEVLPTCRKRQPYISSMLSGNEVSREHRYNRRLFMRLRRGHYTVNPLLKIRVKDDWVGVHDLLRLDDSGFSLADNTQVPTFYGETHKRQQQRNLKYFQNYLQEQANIQSSEDTNALSGGEKQVIKYY